MTRKTLWNLFAVALVATLAYWLFLMSQGKPLSVPQKLPDGTTVAELPGAIVAFEFAGTGPRAAKIVGLWREHGVLEVARDQILLDFVFLFLYPIAIGLGCLLARRHLGPPGSRLHTLGRTLAILQILAGNCDLAENWALLRILDAASTSAAPSLALYAGAAAVFAGVKFALVLAGVGYAATGFVRWLWSKKGSGR